MKTLSFNWSDELKAEIRLRSIEPYTVECHYNSQDFKSLKQAIEQGIDSHLEAINFTEFAGEYGRRGFMFEPETLHVLVRRLMEGDEHAESLASSICETLGIELV